MHFHLTKRIVVCLVGSLLLLGLSYGNARIQAPSQTSDGISSDPGGSGAEGGVLFRAEVSRVVLYATVFDSGQRLVTGLPKEAFHVYQDGKPAPLSGFSNQDIPVSMGLAVDSSASMTDKRSAVNAAALALVRASHPADEVFLVDFKDTVTLAQDFTNDISKLEHGLSSVRMWGGTAVMDATRMAVDHMRKSGQQKKVLVVITDGEDDSSDITENALLALVQKSDVTIYAIGLLSQESSSRRKNATKLLQAVAKVSGGASYFPESVGEVEALATQIAHDIRNQYVLEFPVPANTKLGYRGLRVTADSTAARGKLTVRTRPGYYYQPAGASAQPAAAPSKR